MAGSGISRRHFNKLLAAGLLTTGSGLNAWATSNDKRPLRLRAAAIQMEPELANLGSNLAQAEKLIAEAIRQKAQWIILPEMFTTAAAFHPNMHQAIAPIDGEPHQLITSYAKKYNVVIGGSFLAKQEHGVFNSFILAYPDGSVSQHNKDIPTYWENCYYKKGDDDGVLDTPVGAVGSVLCWEFIRSATARRLFNKVNLIVGGSCWWTLPDEADAESPRRAMNLKMLQQAPVRMAQMIGVPVIHGSHAGRFEAYFSPDLPDVAYNSSYLGEAMIVDAKGNVLARRNRGEGKGIVLAEVSVSASTPSRPIPKDFWIPKEMPKDWEESFDRWLDTGSDYYNFVTEEYLKTGKIIEYVPKYMR